MCTTTGFAAVSPTGERSTDAGEENSIFTFYGMCV